MEEQICLVIKAPSSKYDDFKISCQLSWTILDLKLHICKEYPSKPVREITSLMFADLSIYKILPILMFYIFLLLTFPEH